MTTWTLGWAGICGTSRPVVLDTSASVKLGYIPAGNYETTVTDTIDWLIGMATTDTSRAQLPSGLTVPFANTFDYTSVLTHWRSHGAIDIDRTGYIEFTRDGSGQRGFIAVSGCLDCRPAERGRPDRCRVHLRRF